MLQPTGEGAGWSGDVGGSTRQTLNTMFARVQRHKLWPTYTHIHAHTRTRNVALQFQQNVFEDRKREGGGRLYIYIYIYVYVYIYVYIGAGMRWVQYAPILPCLLSWRVQSVDYIVYALDAADEDVGGL